MHNISSGEEAFTDIDDRGQSPMMFCIIWAGMEVQLRLAEITAEMGWEYLGRACFRAH